MREPSIARIAWLQLSRLRMQGLIAACLLLAAPLVRANVILVAPGAVATGGSTCSLVDAIIDGRATRVEEFDHRHLIAFFDQTDRALETARELHLALISTDPPTQPVFMALHAGKKEIPGKPPAKGGLAEVVRSVVGLADEQALLMSDAAWKALSEPVQAHATSSLKPVPQGAGGQLYEMAWVEPTTAERTKMVTMMWDKQDAPASATSSSTTSAPRGCMRASNTRTGTSCWWTRAVTAPSYASRTATRSRCT